MTPTERARLVRAVTLVWCSGEQCVPPEPCACNAELAEIANHIRRAENDAYERVASWLDKTRYSSALAANVRAMKHEVAN